MIEATTVRTVLGDVPVTALGRIDYHEHLFHASPLLPGEDLDDEAASGAEFRTLLASGFDGIVDATPIGLGRRPAALARIAQAGGGTVIAATGRHRDAHYPDGVSPVDGSDLRAVFLAELIVGMAAQDEDYRTGRSVDAIARTEARAGLVKIGIDYWRISRTEQAALEAAAAVCARTGSPLMVHTEYSSAVFAMLDIVTAHGLLADRVIVAHVDRNPDPGLHCEIAAAGAYLGYDGAARYRAAPESVLIEALRRVVAAGYVERVLVGGDVARRSRYRAYGGLPGLDYLGRRYIPRLERALSAEVLHTLCVSNPARVLGWLVASE